MFGSKKVSKRFIWIAVCLVVVGGLWWRSANPRNVISEQFIPGAVLDTTSRGSFTIYSKTELQQFESKTGIKVDSTSPGWDRLGVSAYAVATQGRSVDYAKQLHGGLNTVMLRPHTGSNGIFITLIDGDPKLTVKYGP
jgi:hypothetical protein